MKSHFYFPPSDSDEWETLSPENLGWSLTAEQELYDFLETHSTDVFLILKNGRIAVEWYFRNHHQNTSWYWGSVGKTLTAFTVGIAQEEGLLDIADKTSDYLGKRWTYMPLEKQELITIAHQLTMTTGIISDSFDCVKANCLDYQVDAGTQWQYHDGSYTLLNKVVAKASKEEWSAYFNRKLRDRIGMNGFWLSTTNLNHVYYSSARSMARFGLLNLNNGVWNGETILEDLNYLEEMKNSSQAFNPAYGYFWWLNGKDTYQIPESRSVLNGNIIPNAPSDMYAGMGKDQKLYIVPSKGLVIVRLGYETSETQLTTSGFDNMLWEKLNDYLN